MVKIQWFYLFLLFLVCPFLIIAQSSHEDSNPEALFFFADVMVNADNPTHRIYAASRFESLFIEELEAENSFHSKFDSLKWVSIITPPDSSFRLFSWQLMKSLEIVQYYAILQKADGSLIRFSDNRPFLNGAELSQYSNEQWYGALYYGIFPFKIGKKAAWVLLGFDSNNPSTNRKIADVLMFEDETAILGAPVFSKKISGGEEIKHRIILEYADGAAGRIQFDRERKMIVFDHLITIFSEGPGKGAIPVPDGSYEAYKLDGKKWTYVEKVFNNVLDEPPREQPVLEGRKGKDLFGRKKN
jgi:hypothetical protein